MNKLNIKVCGMRDPENISGVVASNPDLIGFIFYPESKRFIGAQPLTEIFGNIPEIVKKAGVFVNETIENIGRLSKEYHLDMVQLHGSESPQICSQIKKQGIVIIKAFQVNELFDFVQLKAYTKACDYFLFDTKGTLPGGNGQKFNWSLLEKYTLNIPFFLSGGIEPDDVATIRELKHPQFFGIDINSGFELSPALKDVEKVKSFISAIRSKI